ncbi:hypothetical protein P3S67_027225 [Capsicum chacoense]
MESSNTKSSQKLVKSNSQSPSRSPGRIIRSSSPQHQLMKNNNVLRDEPKEKSVDKNKVQQKSLAKDNTKPVEIKLHTQQRARRRALFNYSISMETKSYFIQLQKKTVEKVQKMIEKEEVRLLRKEMIPRAQLMPLFDKPFLPQSINKAIDYSKRTKFHVEWQMF